MTETLTESFCERCGTRYEFKAPTRLNPLRKTRGLIGGLKNFLTSDDDFSDAMGDAMRGEEGALATAQLEAFHQAFNFCIDCRQYTCLSCWNNDAGRCRTCVPVAGADDLAERLAASASATAAPIAGVAEATMAPEEVQHHLGLEAWPTSDLPEAPAEPAAAIGDSADDAWATTPGVYAATPPVPGTAAPVAPTGGFVGADGFVYDTQEQADAVAAQMEADAAALAAAERARMEAEAAAVAALEARAEADALAAAAAAETEPQPGSPIAPEREPEPVAAILPEPEPEPVAAILPEPEPVAAIIPEPESEPVAAILPEPEPVAAETPRLHVVAWDEDASFDLEPEQEPVAAVIPEPEPEPVAAIAPELEPEPIAAVEPEPEPVVADSPRYEPAVEESAPPAQVEPEPVAAEIAPESELEPVAAIEAEPEPVAAVTPEPEPEPQPEPIAASTPTEPEPEPTPIAPRIAPISETIVRFPQRPAPEPVAAAAEDETPEVAARRAQLDLLGLGDPGEGPLGPDRPAVLPYRSRGAAVTQTEHAILAAAGARFWEASAREVAGAVGHIGVQNCGQCGLSLSANARFCRRCGTRQAQPA